MWGGHRRDVAALEHDLTRHRGHQAGDPLQQRAFPRAVAADDRDDLALADPDRGIAQRLDGAVAQADVLEFKHRADLTFDEFSKYWAETHGRIVLRMPMVHGYVQNHVSRRLLEKLNPRDPFSFDGIVELWFADAEAQKVAFASDAARELPVDELNFIRGITIYPVTEEREDAARYPLKVMVAARLGEGAGRKAGFAQQLAALPGVRVVVVNHLGEVGWRENLWHEPHPPEVLVELGFERDDALPAFAEQPGLAAIHSAVANAGGDVECYLVNPRRII